MRWVIALFVVLLSIPVAQVAADVWHGRPGPELLVYPGSGGVELETRAGRSNFAPIRHSRYRLYDPLAPFFPPHPKTS